MLEQVTTETLQEKAYIAIRDSIIKNDLLPGHPLSIDKLAKDLGVSPTPVREALTRLSADGLVERVRNRTALVARITAEDVHQVYEVRKLLEPYAVSLVAKELSINSFFIIFTDFINSGDKCLICSHSAYIFPKLITD